MEYSPVVTKDRLAEIGDKNTSLSIAENVIVFQDSCGGWHWIRGATKNNGIPLPLLKMHTPPSRPS